MHVPSLVTRGNFGSDEPYVAADFSLRKKIIGWAGHSCPAYMWLENFVYHLFSFFGFSLDSFLAPLFFNGIPPHPHPQSFFPMSFTSFLVNLLLLHPQIHFSAKFFGSLYSSSIFSAIFTISLCSFFFASCNLFLRVLSLMPRNLAASL